MANVKEKNPSVEQEERSQLFQMRLQPKTVERLESLVEETGIQNKSQLVSTSIQLTEEIVRSINAGSKVYIESDDGKTRERLKLVGI